MLRTRPFLRSLVVATTVFVSSHFAHRAPRPRGPTVESSRARLGALTAGRAWLGGLLLGDVQADHAPDDHRAVGAGGLHPDVHLARAGPVARLGVGGGED